MTFQVTITKPDGSKMSNGSFSLRIVKQFARKYAKPKDTITVEEIIGYNSDGYYETVILEEYEKKAT
jgi:hypothetical protein